MPPYAPNRTIWRYTQRHVTAEQIDSEPKWSVLVTFTRIGHKADTQEAVTELADQYVVASGLTRERARALRDTLAVVCDRTYAHGYGDARNTPLPERHNHRQQDALDSPTTLAGVPYSDLDL